MRVWILLCLLTFLTACTPTKVVTRTEVVTETVTQYVEVPPHLSAPVEKGVQPVGDVTFRDVILLWAEDRARLDIANSRLSAIRSLVREDTGEGE